MATNTKASKAKTAAKGPSNASGNTSRNSSAVKSPLALMKEQHGEKAKLVAAVEKFTTDDLWVSRTNKSKGLAHVSNSKLLRLLRTFTEVKDKFGTRAKLIDSILDLEKRSKDAGYKHRLEAFPVPRLYDMYKSTAKRNKAAATAAAEKAEGKTKKAAPKKAAVKTAETKSTAKKASTKTGAKPAAKKAAKSKSKSK